MLARKSIQVRNRASAAVGGFRLLTGAAAVRGFRLLTRAAAVRGFRLLTRAAALRGFRLLTGVAAVRGFRFSTRAAAVRGFRFSTRAAAVGGFRLMTGAAAAGGFWLMAAAAPAQEAPATPPGPTIRSTATEVMLDIVVRDKHGKPVNNIKPGEIEVYEDGVRQELKGFRFVGEREAQAQRAAAANAARGVQAPPQPARPLRSVNLVPIVFYNLDPVSRTRAVQAVDEFLKNDLPPDTYIGLFLLDDHLRAVYPFTNDRAEIARALPNVFLLSPLDFTNASVAVLTANPTLASIAVAVNMASHTASADLVVTGGEVANTAIAGADVGTGPGASAARGAQVTEQRDFSNISGMRETDRIITMIDNLASLPGHKDVLLLTTGLTTTGDVERFQGILNKANEGGISFYPISATGLDDTSTASAATIALGRAAAVSQSQTSPVANGQGAMAAAKEKSRMGDTIDNAVRTSDVQSALRELGEGTGGFLIANTNDFRKPFQKIVEDMDAHYEASYRPASVVWDGRLRQIEIKIARPGVTAEARKGYFAMPDLKASAPLLPFETFGLALLGYTPTPHAFEFSTAAYQFQNEGANWRGVVAFGVSGTALAARANPGRLSHSLHASLLALVKDESGQVIDKFSVDAPFEIPDTNFAAVRQTPLVYTHDLDLPSGRYTMDAVMMDRESGRSSVSSTPFTIAAAAKGTAISSPMLVQRVEAITGQADPADPLVLKNRRLVPYVDTNLPADAKPYAYFVVYPNKSNTEKPKLQVEFRVNGQVLANQTAALPAPEPSGAIPMMIRAATHPGQCELKLTVVQGSESASRTLTYSAGK
jgi:VWFA-related protein